MGIDVQNIKFKYAPLDKDVLKGVTFKVNKENELIFILGHTGSGKTTLVQNMNALLLPYDGNIKIFDQNVIKKRSHRIRLNTKKNQIRYNFTSNHKLFAKSNMLIYNPNLKALRKHIGLVFQFPEYQLFESTVLKDVMFGPKNFGYKEDEALSLSKKALSLVGISESYYDKSPFLLSGGQMRRVAIAGILAINPDIIILDEPTVGLDPKGKQNLMALLTHIQKESNKSIIIISHDMNIVGQYAKRVVVMDKGKKVYDGSPRALFSNEELYLKYNLSLPTPSALAKELKNRGLINYNKLPLSKKELEDVILGGDINE